MTTHNSDFEQLVYDLQNYSHDSTTRQFFADFDPTTTDTALREGGYWPQMGSYQYLAISGAESTIRGALSDMAAGRHILDEAVVAPVVVGDNVVICGIARWVQKGTD